MYLLTSVYMYIFSLWQYFQAAVAIISVPKQVQQRNDTKPNKLARAIVTVNHNRVRLGVMDDQQVLYNNENEWTDCSRPIQNSIISSKAFKTAPQSWGCTLEER